MAATKRAQILMDPAEYRALEDIARARGVSVAELVRDAVRGKYLHSDASPRRAAELLCSMELPLAEDWADLERELEARGDDVLPR